MMQVHAGVVLALIGSLLGSSLIAGSASAAVIATSTFDSNTEGWTAVIIDDAGNVTPSTVSFAAGAGTPGGALRHDAPSDSKTSFFLAPSSIVTGLHSAVGGFVSWDISTIKQSGDVFFSSTIDINIRAGTNRIRLSVAPPAPPIFPTYVRYSLVFGTEAGWLFFDGTNTTTATQAQINSVLAGAESFIIRAEYWSSVTPDTTFLDNVVIADSTPQGGRIDGAVTDPGGNPVLGALVQVCPTDGSACASFGTTNALGNYAAFGLPDDDYVVRAFPPAGSTLIPAQIDVTISSQSRVTGADIQLGAPIPPPPGTGISPTRPGGGGVSRIYWHDTTTLTTTGCSGAAATYEIVQDSTILASRPMTESPPGSGHYTATVAPFHPNHGNAVVHIHIVCPGGSTTDVSFPIYIDPSGVVRTVYGTPVSGATVTLFRSDSGGPGSFVQVPNGSGIMSPSNRNNPDTTNALGQFGWDVLTGFYIVQAEKAGCTSADGSKPFAESAVLTIPPEVIDLDLRLKCPGVVLTALSPANVWVGLKNSDDVGTHFDLKAEVYKDTTLIGWGQADGKVGGSSGFSNAKLDSIPLTLLAPVDVPPGAALSIKLSARITCSRGTHASGTARLWFNDAQAKSRFDATIGGATNDYYLLSGSALGPAQGSGPKRTIDVGVNNKAACPTRPFTPFGTWSITLP